MLPLEQTILPSIALGTMTSTTSPTPPPSGTVSFLFTDIEGSTALWDRHPRAMRAALERHDLLLRSAITAQGGHVFKTVGDAFCAAFPTADAAIQAALTAQRAIQNEAWSEIDPELPALMVRMGLHTGVATERGGDYFGPPVNRVARIEAAGNGGQILLSLATQQLVRESLPEGCRLRELGTHRLKDLSHSETLFQLVVPDLPDERAALRTVEALHPRDRIIVDDSLQAGSAPGGNLSETLQATLDAVRGDGAEHTVTLSSAQLAELSRHRPTDLVEYRLGRIAEWSQPQYRLDGRFVELTLLIDRGEEVTSGRWVPQEERFEDMRAVLASIDEPAVVLLGPPGAGKSTLMRRFELDTAIDMLREEPATEAEDRVTFFIQLNHFKPSAPGAPLPAPGDWLAESWTKRFPDLPTFEALINQGRMLLLLDALNEVPADSEADYYRIVGLFKDYVHALVHRAPGNRVVFSCRSLEYSAPLSTPAMRVPQIRIEKLTDLQVQRFLELYSPATWQEIWAELDASPQLEVLRSPYFLKLLTDQVEAEGSIPKGRAGLFTGFVRQALRREIERGNPIFQPGRLLEMRDLRRITGWRWRTPWELPDRGLLLPKLRELAYELQNSRSESKASQVRVSFDDALDLLDDEQDEDILRAGTALSVLDEDPVNDEILFIHQLVQEFFAARRLAEQPAEAPDLVASPWRADAVHPSLDEIEAMIAPADPLPSLPATGWEQTVLLAAAMTADPDDLVEAVAETNLPLAGRAAAQPESRVGEAVRERLRQALVARSRDPQADLRARIEAGLALGRLGDPRFERIEGQDGQALLPPFVAFAAGDYRIGRDDSDEPDESPAHDVPLAAFAIARFPVTNAEWRLFMNAGGYTDERWWDTEAALAWQRGEGTMQGLRNVDRYWLNVCRDDPEQLEQKHVSGLFDDETYARWRAMLEMDASTLEAHLSEIYPGGPVREPRYWQDERFNHSAKPVVGICWFEARAYCNWLSAQSGRCFRLPTEPEWEAAARGTAGRRYAFGEDFDRDHCNAIETHLRGTTPIGVFPGGDTPEGLADMTGNAWDWTANVAGRSMEKSEYLYPYNATDGREDPEAGADVIRVGRGGSWCFGEKHLTTTGRYSLYPDARNYNLGMRLAESLGQPPA
jgi:formylglycine-generating enzyme required for sulfatase activity/class 3 adenylate cyclase